MLENSALPARIHEDAETPRYGLVAQWAHWITALLIFAVVVIAWVMIEAARDNPSKQVLFTIHKALGVTILGIVVLRLLWRAANPAPPLPDHMPRWESFLAKLSHALLYFLLLAMPISGFILSQAGGHAVSFFYLFDLPAIVPENKGLSKAAEEVHESLQWALYALVVLHILATGWHVQIRRDGVFNRMLPQQTNAK